MLSTRHMRGASGLLSATLLALWSLAAPLRAQENRAPEISAAELVRLTIAHEMKAAEDDSHKHLFRSRRQIPRGSQTRLYIETNDSMAGMTIAYNDQPLTAQQQKAEQDHLAWLASNPEQLRKKRAQEKADEQRTLRILRALPNAFLYEYDGTETAEATVGKAGDPLTKLKFTPNPSYSPPSRVEQVLQGLKGYLLIDASAHRLARIEGTLFRDVTFGWGIIGHLDKGGYFRVQQADVGDGSWEITSMKLKVTGKILLFRGLSITTDEVFSDFREVRADLTFAEAVELLKAQQEKLARGTESGGGGY
ncbi:MAG: hypothetical protein ACM3WP_13695 [Acidobacteriota bacterium]